MVFSGCFYDLIAAIFADQSAKTEAKLLTAARTAGALLVEGAKTAPITPRLFQSVGRAMVLADQQLNGGANRDRIRAAFRNTTSCWRECAAGGGSFVSAAPPGTKERHWR